MKPSEHACKIFFNYSKLCVISFFAKKVQFLPPEHASRCLSKEFSQHYWQEQFDGDSFISQSRFDACADLPNLKAASEMYGWGRDAPRCFKFSSKLVKSQPCCKRVGHSIFSDLFEFFLVAMVVKFVRTTESVSAHHWTPPPPSGECLGTLLDCLKSHLPNQFLFDLNVRHKILPTSFVFTSRVSKIGMKFLTTFKNKSHSLAL